MNGLPAERTQVDGDQEMWSFDGGLDCSDAIDMARQEQKDEADVNKILARYGVNAPQRQSVFGETDFTLDLQQAFSAIEAAKNAFSKLPQNLRDKYPTWQAVLNGLDSGAFRIDLAKPAPEGVGAPAAPEAPVTV